MQHALALARKGIGLASPNPHVGCVVVRDGQIVGEGFHQYEWRDHAEIVALKSAGEKARGATLYVNFEPCNHTGRTGPCTEAIIAAGARRVVAAMQDPNPATSGRGFQRRKRLLRVILDTKLRLPPKSRIVQTADDDLLVFTAATRDSPKARKLQKEGVELLRVRANRSRIDLKSVLSELGKRDILSVLLESGPSLNGAALSGGLVHTLMLFYAPKFAGETGVPFAHMLRLAQPPLPNFRVQQFGPDVAVGSSFRHDAIPNTHVQPYDRTLRHD